MSRFILKIWPVLILILPSQIKAHESWRTQLRIAGGVIYSQIEHPTIALEKEVLIYEGDGKCQALFLFRNTADKPITVEASFPVKITLPLSGFSYVDPSKDILRKFYGHNIIPDENFFETRSLDPKSVNLNMRRGMSWKLFETFAKQDGYLVNDLTITLNDQMVSIDSVFWEAQVLPEDTLVISMHFLHKLFFQPNREAIVKVKYSSFSQVIDSGESYLTDYFVWRYVLGTGRTWKGPIQAIYILTPDPSPALPASFARAGEINYRTVHLAMNYEPRSEDEIRVDDVLYGQLFYSEPGRILTPSEFVGGDSAQIIRSLPEPKAPAQDFVKVINASSFLPQRTWVNSFFRLPISANDPYFGHSFYPYDAPESYQTHYANVPITCPKIGFGPLSLFDGIPESAWCEGVKGAGLGEWVEFELKEEVWGLTVYNGFQKASWCWCSKESPSDKRYTTFDTAAYERLEAIYADNNRVKVLEIISTNGEIRHKIQLQDRPEGQGFRTIPLPKGTYKLFVREVYKGAKWDDTCLGEIEFYPTSDLATASAAAKALMEAHPFLKSALGY